MKRSGGVTAAAVVLIVGSGFLVLMAGMVGLLPMLPQPANEQNPFGMGFFYFEAVFILAVAGWGIATAVGILRLRNWARISILVISGLAIVMSFFTMLMTFLLVPMISQEAKIPPGAVSFIEIFELIMFGIPLGIAIWWMALFLLKSVKVQFGAAQLVGTAQAPAGIGPTVATSVSSPPSGAKIPVSILVIAIYFLATAPFFLLTFTVPFMRHLPVVVLGTLVRGGLRWEFVLVTAILHVVLGLGLLWRKTWAHVTTCAYCVFLLANSIAIIVRPAALDQMLKAVQDADPFLAQSISNLQPTFFHYEMYGGAVFGIALAGTALYFLLTRREAYRMSWAAKG
ncbi:MAG TPA: hypothetical protein VGS15_00645 [Candidatus Acidoferrales bacterium]|nr:hypothetical protein [Candidatus Acidoferrales bacterium]